MEGSAESACERPGPTTIAMGTPTEAAVLRLLYVIGAVALVLVVNRFFFPTSFRSQMKYNLEMLFHMHHMYLRVLEDSLTDPLDYWKLCDAQLQYHMVHAQIRSDLPRAAKGEEEGYLEILAITWRMASEIQQMFSISSIKNGLRKHVRSYRAIFIMQIMY